MLAPHAHTHTHLCPQRMIVILALYYAFDADVDLPTFDSDRTRLVLQSMADWSVFDLESVVDAVCDFPVPGSDLPGACG